MSRFVAVFVAVGVSVAIAGTGTAHAQSGMSTALPNGATLKFERFQVWNGMKLVDAMDGDEVRFLLNSAHCSCSQATPDEPTFGYVITLSATTGLTRPLDVFVGASCDDPQQIATKCRKVDTISSLDTIRNTETTIEIPLYRAINVNSTEACVADTTSATVWLMVDTDGNSTYDHWTTTVIPKPYEDPSLTGGIDTKAPTLPANLKASGSEEAIEISWDRPSDGTDLFYFQAFCALADGDAKPDGIKPPEARYQRVSDVCGSSTNPALTPIDPGSDSPVVPAPAAFTSYDPTFLCGQSEQNSTSLTIKGLRNNTAYKVAFVAVDNYGNFNGAFFTKAVSPQPVTDLWEDLNGRDSAVDGGCLLSTTYGDGNPLTRALRSFRDDTLARSALGRWLTDAYYATIGKLAVSSWPARIAVGLALLPFVAFALLWHLLGLPALLALLALPWLWRRRAWLRILLGGRGRRLAMAGTVSALLLAPSLAAADDFMPYWEDPAQESGGSLDEPDEVRWHVGIRVGPYIPDIDLQFHQNANTGMGPYEAMFGDYFTRVGEDEAAVYTRHNRRVSQVMPMLDVDRIVWRGFGHIGVGGSLGYMQQSAYAYSSTSSQDDPRRDRVTSAENTFRLIPFAATVTYRFTYLDDRWGIPVVPYVRGGLSYYVWWMKGPNGDVSKACDSGDDPCTDEDKAYGGTYGVQGSAGIAIRAERIDADAARSMRNSGIQHAGFYGEVFWGRVDGFGSSTKLWVGDTTWFAGANFEF